MVLGRMEGREMVGGGGQLLVELECPSFEGASDVASVVRRKIFFDSKTVKRPSSKIR